MVILCIITSTIISWHSYERAFHHHLGLLSCLKKKLFLEKRSIISFYQYLE